MQPVVGGSIAAWRDRHSKFEALVPVAERLYAEWWGSEWSTVRIVCGWRVDGADDAARLEFLRLAGSAAELAGGLTKGKPAWVDWLDRLRTEPRIVSRREDPELLLEAGSAPVALRIDSICAASAEYCWLVMNGIGPGSGTGAASDTDAKTAAASMGGPMKYPNRSRWLKAALQEAKQTPHSLQAKFGGPNHASTKKVLRGEPVSDNTLERIIQSLILAGLNDASPRDIPDN